ncbi:MAG: ribosome biogenesis GTPase YlqF [Caloramator sp.]|nr:ribosome biogenesis GTPase YlqF [Caloramator sp.]
MNIQWYPGHMVKSKREITESLKLIDVVIEILDARIPESSKNPEIDKIIGNKLKIVILNKCDLAEDTITSEWIKYFKNKGYNSIDVDSSTGKNIQKVYNIVKETIKDKIERQMERGIIGRPIRALILGIPNVGKSTFINKLTSKSSAKTGDKPGVTRSRQWIKVNSSFELLDTPGILWPKFDDKKTALHLAFTRAIKDEILDIEELSFEFIKEIIELKPNALVERYNIEISSDPLETLERIGKKRGCVISGGNIDTIRTSNIILEDYRTGKMGKISLERPRKVD